MVHTTKQSSWFRFSLITLFILGIGGGALWYYSTHIAEGIYPYNAREDKSFVLNLFKNDWYWLVSDYSPDYSPEHMLDNKASSQDPKNNGNLTIKVYRIAQKPVGFVAYFMRELLEGYILFLGIDKEARSKGYARKLLSYAINDLNNRGAAVIRLITRTDNQRGRKLYTGMGFKEIWTDGAYVKYEKKEL